MAIQVNKRMVEVYTTSNGKEYADREQAEKHEKMLIEKNYRVTYYFTGTYITQVRAFDKEEAIEKAREIDYPYSEEIEWEEDSVEAKEI